MCFFFIKQAKEITYEWYRQDKSPPMNELIISAGGAVTKLTKRLRAQCGNVCYEITFNKLQEPSQKLLLYRFVWLGWSGIVKSKDLWNLYDKNNKIIKEIQIK